MLSSTLTLNNLVKIPVIGLGTYQIPLQNCTSVVSSALNAGYRHIDSAIFYRNHKAVASSISGYDRNSLFISSKVPPNMQSYDTCIKAVENSLLELDTTYLDLMLVHWPGVTGLSPSDPKQVDLRHETWSALEELYKQGKIKAIGVSNFLIIHLEKLLKVAKVKPTVNQVEFHPWCYSPDLLNFCHNEKIIIEAYSPLARGLQELWQDSTLSQISEKYSVTKAQVLLRWNIQKGNVILPKSVNPARIEENSKLDFILNEDDMSKLSELKTQKRTCWDPNSILV